MGCKLDRDGELGIEHLDESLKLLHNKIDKVQSDLIDLKVSLDNKEIYREMIAEMVSFIRKVS